MSRVIANMASNLVERVQTFNLPFSKQDQAVIDDLRLAAQNSENPDYPAPKGLRGGFSICRPIGPVPAHYGQGIPSLAPLLTDERMKTLPTFGGQ